jgi:hypothetical protein
MATVVGRPQPSEYSTHYAPFVARVPDGDIVDLLTTIGALRDAAVRKIDDGVAARQPPAGKWNVRETLGHLADMERMLTYRALRIARDDRSPLFGIDQDTYAANSYANARTIASLALELRALRTSTVCLFQSIPANVWQRQDVIEGDAVSLRALAYIIVGHDLHHLEQLADRFGVELARAR